MIRFVKEGNAELEEWGIHIILGGIILPNDISVAMHEEFGMKKVVHLAEIGYKFNEWRGVSHLQKKLG
ncbi:MAG: hypothetical protein WD053_00935 [Gracilimonas sp.]